MDVECRDNGHVLGALAALHRPGYSSWILHLAVGIWEMNQWTEEFLPPSRSLSSPHLLFVSSSLSSFQINKSLRKITVMVPV